MASSALPVAEITTQLDSSHLEKFSHLEKNEDATPLQLLDIPGYDQDLSWSIHEERVAVRKVDLCILTFIVLLFTFMQFDRTNISAALTDTLRKDINVNTSQINTAQTLFILGFILTEIPFNIITKKIGAETWLPITMFLWGVCTWCQIFMKSASGLFALRFFIGAMEGGYIPGTYSRPLSHSSLTL
jgi:sugar phosphate permease